MRFDIKTLNDLKDAALVATDDGDRIAIYTEFEIHKYRITTKGFELLQILTIDNNPKD